MDRNSRNNPYNTNRPFNSSTSENNVQNNPYSSNANSFDNQIDDDSYDNNLYIGGANPYNQVNSNTSLSDNNEKKRINSGANDYDYEFSNDFNDDDHLEQYQQEQIQAEAGNPPFRDDGIGMEEYAAEVANPVIVRSPVGQRTEIRHDEVERIRRDEDEQVREGGALGWIALILSIASLFVWQPILGPAAVIVGIFAWIRGNRALGSWSIVLGMIAIIAYFFLVPYYS